ncbi:MAG: rhodanese-like domain-containing protein [Burkholderiaceae bacterium]
MDFLLYQNNYLILFVAVASGIMLAMPNLLKGGAKTLAVPEAVRLANQNDGLFIDIRNHDAFKAGAIPQARNIPVADINTKTGSLPKDKPLIVYCEQGRESMRIARSLRKQGFDQVYSIDGGLRGWLQAGMPVSKKH